jgi:hypothetical protein
MDWNSKAIGLDVGFMKIREQFVEILRTTVKLESGVQ